MKVIFDGSIEIEAVQNSKGHYVVGNTLVSVDGLTLRSGFAFPEPTYTREQILAMTVAELDVVEHPLEIDGYYAMLKADKQTAILEALGL